MQKQTGMRQARNARRTNASVAECRHLLEACSHKIGVAGACRRYAVGGGRSGHLAWSLIL